jgi:predicted component of viral defense system (DUF524 family)
MDSPLSQKREMMSVRDHTINVPFYSKSGIVVTCVAITPVRKSKGEDSAPLVVMDENIVSEHGETTIQLCESERYEYEVIPAQKMDLRLRCSLSNRRRSLGNDGEKPDAGLIETRSFCGTLLLELVEGEVNDEKPASASALLDVRSLKLDYRTEYRGMLRRLSDEIAALVADARSSTKTGFRSTFEERTDTGWLQIQLELLRETLDSADFSAALHRILNFPHEQLSTFSDSVSTNRPIRWTQSAVRQLVTRNPRREVPTSHPLYALGLRSVAERVRVPHRLRDLDTLENRFIKFALGEFRAFLTHAQSIFESKNNINAWGASAALSRRLAGLVEDWLGRNLFREVGEMGFAPLGSPVLQRKAGYREVLRWWLRFRTAAELSWKGGEELFHVGQRDVASLYEYWLFFELLSWFCKKCRGGDRPAVEELIEGLEEGSPNLRLRKQYQLGPFAGTFAGQSRRLQARFTYNRRFEATKDRHKGGSWTRRLHPDYTLTFWPADLQEEEAEQHELLVHIHLDAKYRVENIEGLFGPEDADDSDDEVEGNYKRQDLLKMHAYRDAIKRSQGAYVLYPGRASNQSPFKGFHEILPGLGAFGVAPDEHGAAQGMESLEQFLDKVLAHLGNRTTAQERVSYHVAESYTPDRVKEDSVLYGSLVLAEQDEMSDTKRALPPAEHHVVVAWYDSPEQLAWTQKNGIANVRLGKRRGTWHIPPEMASARHVLLRSYGGEVAQGLFRLKLNEPGYKIYSAKDLIKSGYPGTAGGEIYAVFKIEPDVAYAGRTWDENEITKQIKIFESRRPYRQEGSQVNSLGRTSPDPRVLSLQELLRAMR